MTMLLLRNHCRQRCVQLGKIDALLTQLWIPHGLLVRSVEQDFAHAAKRCTPRLWCGP